MRIAPPWLHNKRHTSRSMSSREQFVIKSLKLCLDKIKSNFYYSQLFPRETELPDLGTAYTPQLICSYSTLYSVLKTWKIFHTQLCKITQIHDYLFLFFNSDLSFSNISICQISLKLMSMWLVSAFFCLLLLWRWYSCLFVFTFL